MGTRRPMNRVNSANGRYYDSHGSSNGSTSDSEDSNGSVYSPRADSRSYLLNVRPENRTTFCNIISQLTEETQPCFETTLKARAVSEGCDAKFICMVTGYPEPEVTWYKDDQELDRYCGLPKYEILHNGKRHTLQIYKCSEEDAAIYQASARNNKGIVTCSGILEVGTMTEYKIHQRWFAKLKRKAEAKMREIEQSRRRVKENFEEGERLRALSPERIQRKRRFSSENKEDTSLSVAKDDLVKVPSPDPNSRMEEEITNTNEQPHNLTNGFSVLETQQKEEVTTNGYTVPENIEENGKEFLAYVYETVEVITKKTTLEESYAKKKKKDEAPPLPGSVKEETAQGSTKKPEGISPAPRRSRFGKDVAKTADGEKMEVQRSTLTSNKRFAPSTAPKKIGKTIAIKDTKKLKDSIMPSSKAVESPIPKPGHLQTKDDVNFSLKEMYFGDSLALPEGEVGTQALERDKKVKSEGTAHSANPSKPLTQGKMKEVPKAAPRRSKEQRELSVGRKPPPTTVMKTEVPVTAPGSNVSQIIPASKTKCELQKPPVENPPDSSTYVSVPVCDTIDHNLEKVESAVLVPSANLSAEIALQNGIKDKPIILNKDKSTFLESHEPQASETNMLSSVDPDEEKTRIETLQKLQNLEIEYMALQKAYALLQKQLEISQKAEAEKIREVSEDAESTVQKQTDTTEVKDMKTVENTEDNVNLIKCPSSPIPIYMEIEDSTQAEAIPVVDTINQGGQLETLQMHEVIPSVIPMHSPVSFLETSSGEVSYVKDVSDNQQINMMDKVASEPIAVSRETKDVESDEVTLKVRELSNDSLTEHVNIEDNLTSEVEMMEDVKEKEPMLEDISVGSLPGAASTSQEVKAIVTEEKLTLTGEEIPNVETQIHLFEMSKNVPDIDIPYDNSSKLSLSSEQNQSVATLLRDVKKALESGVTSTRESSVDSSSVHSPMALPLGVDQYDTELMPPLAHTEETCRQELVTPVTKSTNLKEQQSEADLSTVELSATSQADSQQNVQDNITKQEKQDHSLVTTLKNSLLMLLHIKTADVVDHKPDEKGKKNVGDAHLQSPVDIDLPEKNVSPPSSRKMYESGKDSDSPQSTESMHSSSTSGKLTPTSEEDMVQNVDSLPTSPTIPKRMTESLKKEDIIAQVSSAPLSPVTPRWSSKGIQEGTILSKEDLSFSPSTSRKIAAKIALGTDSAAALSVPSIVVGSLPAEKTLGCMHFDSQRDSSRKWKSTENLAPIPSATPEELASGARRKIFLPKSKQLDDEEIGSTDSLSPPSRKESPNVSPGLSRRNKSLLASQSPPVERRSPGTMRRMGVLEVPKIHEETVDKGKDSESYSQEAKDLSILSKEDAQSTESKKVNDPYKAPQVIRKVRAEQFSDASGNLKLWCQFFNILNDSVITWYKDEVQVAKVKRCSGDEGQAALAIVQASVKDCGVYQCTIQNDYGVDSTDCLLSPEILSGFITKEEAEVGEEIEMTPMVFAKGLADSGYWGDKFFGRLVMEEPHVGMGFLRKSCRVKVIYGLEPMFESGKTCIIKIRNLITFGTKNESTLVEKNYDITIQDCKIQNTTREYCKIFAAECRGVPNFGQFPEILPLNLIYRPANNIPYATIEEDLEGWFERYCIRDLAGKLLMKNGTEIEQKCCTFQHWVYQWTNGNFLVTTLEGVGWKLTNIAIVTKSKGYQGLKESCYPEVLEEFPSVHQCNNYCEMLGLKSIKATDSLLPPPKPKGSRSPQMGRKTGSAQSSPQIQKKLLSSPQSARKGGVSPKSTRKATDTGEPQSGAKHTANNGSTTAKPQ